MPTSLSHKNAFVYLNSRNSVSPCYAAAAAAADVADARVAASAGFRFAPAVAAVVERHFAAHPMLYSATNTSDGGLLFPFAAAACEAVVARQGLSDVTRLVDTRLYPRFKVNGIQTVWRAIQYLPGHITHAMQRI